MHVAVIINPIAGSSGRDAGRFRAELAARLLARTGTSHEILVTERGGHARELAEGAVGRGATVVCAWGGDGTVNEVATTLVGRRVPLAIVPAGSGNGLARELGVPFAPAEALKLALGAAECRIDVGEFGGRLFMNMAGVGFDAAVSARFAAGKRRGFVRYLSIAATGMRSYRPARYDVAVEGVTTSVVAWMIVLANSRQYGSGAIIAPGAKPDDGQLELVVVHDQPAWRIAARSINLFRGTLDERSGVSFRAIEKVSITGDTPLVFHVDGEPVEGGRTLHATIHPKALSVKVPIGYSTKR